jgi:hypothetical protein
MALRLPLPVAEFPVASNETLRGNDASSTEISSVVLRKNSVPQLGPQELLQNRMYFRGRNYFFQGFASQPVGDFGQRSIPTENRLPASSGAFNAGEFRDEARPSMSPHTIQ